MPGYIGIAILVIKKIIDFSITKIALYNLLITKIAMSGYPGIVILEIKKIINYIMYLLMRSCLDAMERRASEFE